MLFDQSQYEHFLQKACRSAQKFSGIEICGLIVDTGHNLSLVETRNVSRHSGSFILSSLDVRRIVSATKVLGQEVVGTWHSHPAAEAIPGKSDIQHSVDDSLMFIFDCFAKKGRVWKIKNGKARELRYGLI